MWEIAKKYGVDFEEVKQLNSQLSSPDMIMPGMKVKIPSSTKAVKKKSEEMNMVGKKENKMQEVSPKPLTTIKEDDMKKPKEVKMEMPKYPMSQPTPMQPMMQMPVMDQEMHNHTTINLPEFTHYEKKEMPKQKKPKEMPHMPQQEMPPMKPMPQMSQQEMSPMKPMPQMPQQEMPPMKPMQQMYQQEMPPMEPMSQMPQQVPMVPMCCYFIHPCWHQHGVMPFEAHPLNGQMNQQPGLGPMEMHNHPMHSGTMHNCGCQQQSQFPHQHMRHPMPVLPGSGFNPVEMKQQIPSNYKSEPKYTPQFSHEPFAQPYPTPPEYSTFSGVNDQEDDHSTE